jgi:AcrR family transcriptional regulator
MTRAEQARATRRRILAAATEQFLRLGYGATTLDQIAEQAGVAVQTVYFHFGNKRTLLKEALDVAAVGDDQPIPVLERPWVDRVRNEPDPARMIALWVAGGRSIFERGAPLMRVVRGATETDPDLAAQWATNEQQTRTGFGVFAELLARRQALKPGMSIKEAGDIAFALGGIDTYLLLTGTCGWSPARWQKRTTAILIDALLR